MAIESPADNDERMDMSALWAAIRRRWLRIVLVTVLLLAGTYALLLFVPKSYESTASILVENRDSVYTRPANDVGNSSQMSADELSSLISSQMQLVQSRDTLQDVVRSQNLAAVPEFNGTASSPLSFLNRFFRKSTNRTAEDVAIDSLGEHLTVIRERDSAIISVIVRSADPQRAADLANAIANADVARRAGLSLSDTVDASHGLQQQITQMRQRVADAESKVANFKVNNDLYTGANNTSLLDQQMSDLSNQITAAQGRKNTAQSRATLIRGLLSAGQPIDGVEDVRNSATIQQLMTQKAQLTSQRAQLLATLLPNHPTVRAVIAQIVEIDKQISVEGRRVADALSAEAKIEDALQTSLEANLVSLKAKAGDATKQGVTLEALAREAKADRDLLEGYLSRYGDAASRTDANAALPDVRVVTLASPASTPASPKTPLILSAVAFVSLAVQISGVLFGELLSGRALVEPDRQVRAVEPDEVVAIDAERPAADESVPAAVEMQNESTPVEPEPDPAVMEKPARNRRNLRTWFTKHARTVGASLTTFEPPMTAAAEGAEPPAAVPAENGLHRAGLEAHQAAAAASEYLGDGESETDRLEEAANAERLANLSADLILGRARIVLLASIETQRESEVLAERLAVDVLHRGLSVARVDAGSGRPSTEPGITDLSAERASFGDVVHKTAKEGLAEVPWGHLTTLDRRSTRPITLVEALSDIYEVVIVLTGRIGMASTLPLFAGLPCRLILVSSAGTESAAVESARADAAALGFGAFEIIAAPSWQAEVA